MNHCTRSYKGHVR